MASDEPTRGTPKLPVTQEDAMTSICDNRTAMVVCKTYRILAGMAHTTRFTRSNNDKASSSVENTYLASN
ncbi:hypothetical protein ACVIYL_009058 [Bradyrhizobium sp. USDA 3315]